MIGPARRKELLAEAERLAADLRAFRTPSTGEPVARSRLAEVWRFLEAYPTLDDLRQFLQMLSGSYLGKATQSAQPQFAEAARRLQPLVQRVPDPLELRYVLGWAQRLLPDEQGSDHRGGGPRSRNQGRTHHGDRPAAGGRAGQAGRPGGEVRRGGGPPRR